MDANSSVQALAGGLRGRPVPFVTTICPTCRTSNKKVFFLAGHLEAPPSSPSDVCCSAHSELQGKPWNSRPDSPSPQNRIPCGETPPGGAAGAGGAGRAPLGQCVLVQQHGDKRLFSPQLGSAGLFVPAASISLARRPTETRSVASPARHRWEAQL